MRLTKLLTRMIVAEAKTDVGRVNVFTIVAILLLVASGRAAELLLNLANGTASTSIFEAVVIVAGVGIASMWMLVLLRVVENLEAWLLASRPERTHSRMRGQAGPARGRLGRRRP